MLCCVIVIYEVYDKRFEIDHKISFLGS